MSKKIALLFLLLIIALLFSISVGAFEIPLQKILHNNLEPQEIAILFNIRLPRILLSALVGASLAISGAAIQGMFRNPLADPGLIGISSGSALAVALVLILPWQLSEFFNLYALSIAAFIGATISCIVIFNFARIGNNFSVTYLLLAGIAINALMGAATGFLTYISNDQQLRALTFWTMGNFGGSNWQQVLVCASIALPVIFFLSKNAHNIDLLILGEDEAKYLGVDCEKLKKRIVICSALLVGVSVAFTGIIGFVGLVVPHLIRISIAPNHKILLPISAISGALLLVVADSFSRIIISPAELPVGIVTSLIGGPFFLWLLLRQYSRN